MIAKAITGVLLGLVLTILPSSKEQIINNSITPTQDKVQALEKKPNDVKPSQVPVVIETEQQQVESKPVVHTPATPMEIAQSKAAELGWVGSEWEALVDLWHKESGWNPNAVNSSSGACGIPQALPCSKIPNPNSAESQIDWGLEYIRIRYNTPSKALNFWHYGAPSYNGTNWY